MPLTHWVDPVTRWLSLFWFSLQVGWVTMISFLLLLLSFMGPMAIDRASFSREIFRRKLNRVDLSWVFCCFDSLFWTGSSGDFGIWPALEESRVDAIQIEFDILRWHPQISFEGTNPPYPLIALGYEPYMRQAQSWPEYSRIKLE